MIDNNNIPVGYKDTPVGIIPEEWEVYDLKEFAFLSKEKYEPSPLSLLHCVELEHLSQGDGILLGRTQVSLQKSTKNVFKKGDILFGKLRPYLRKYWMADFNGVCSSEIWVLKTNNKICINEFLFRLVSSNRFIQRANVSIGSKMPRADWNFVSISPFALPPIAEQKKIAEILCTWDDAIEKQSKLIEKLELRKRGLMQRLLTGKTRLPGFTEPWKKIKLGDVCCIVTGRLDANAMVSNGEYPFFTCAKEVYKINNYSFDTEALLVSGNGEYVGYVHYYKGKFNAYQRTYVLDGFNCNIFYMYYALKQYLPKRIMRTKSNSNTPYIVKDTLFDMELLLPSDVEQKLIAKLISSADKEIETQRKKLEALRQQKQGLMQQLLTGKTRVKVS